MKVYNSFLAGGLVVGTMAGVSPPSSDPPMAYFDPYGKPGCREGSQGLYTITQTQDSICYVFPTTIQSAFVASIISGCVVYVYDDTNCSTNEVTLDVGVENCYDQPKGMGSYRVVCGRRYPTPRSSSTSSSLSVSASQR